MFDLHWFSKLINIKLDVYEDFKLTENENDKILLSNYGAALQDVAKTCFHRCIQLNYEHYTKYEEDCIKNCVGLQAAGLTRIVEKFERYGKKQEEGE